ncbi:MAG: glycosyltransferase [bacterium]|nr:glycosyltransferase [bacterium]
MTSVNEANSALAIVIPCYNCGSAVKSVVEQCRAYSGRILLVNDGSDENTTRAIEECGAEMVGWAINRGKGSALLAGFDFWLKRDGWDWLATLDSDGQHAPNDLAALMEARNNGAEFIAGRRVLAPGETPNLRRWANRTSTRLIRILTGCPLNDIQCGYRMFSRKALEQLRPRLTSESYAIETEMALLATRMGLRMAEAEVQSIYTEESTQRSAWRPLMDSWRIAKVTARFLGKRQ